MLRFLLLITFCLLVAFTGLGAVLSREWGWNEYASDELFVVYTQPSEVNSSYHIVSTDGRSEGARLNWDNGNIVGMDCSPDGRRLAFLTDTPHLYVLTKEDIDYEKALPLVYHNVNVANNGRSIVSEMRQDTLAIDADQVRSVQLSQVAGIGASFQITSDGWLLYTGERQINPGIKLTSLTNSATHSVTQDYWDVSEQWLASEQMFIYLHLISMNNYQLFWVNTSSWEKVLLSRNNVNSTIISPDATRLVFSYWYDDIQQLYLSSPLSSQIYEFEATEHFQQITFNQVDSIPLCFLTFRPQLLMDAAS